jgi:hypothetical protein
MMTILIGSLYATAVIISPISIVKPPSLEYRFPGTLLARHVRVILQVRYDLRCQIKVDSVLRWIRLAVAHQVDETCNHLKTVA